MTSFLIWSDVDLYAGSSVTSGLNTAWLEEKKSRKKRAAEFAEKMDDEAALSTRPNFPPTQKFDCKAANTLLAKANLEKRNPSRKNTVCFFCVVIKYSLC